MDEQRNPLQETKLPSLLLPVRHRRDEDREEKELEFRVRVLF
jgi:hypothetical protein